MKILLFSMMSGNLSRNAFAAMNSAGILHSYHTKTALADNAFIRFLISCHIFPSFRRRLFPSDSIRMIHSYWFNEIAAVFFKRLHMKWVKPSLFDSYCQGEIFDKKVAKYLEKHIHEVDAVYGYENASYYTFKKAKEHGIKCIYELPIGYWRYKEKILSQQASIYPDWSNTMEYAHLSSHIKEKKDMELKLADKIVVPSMFVKESLSSYPGSLAPVHIVPYGGPNNFSQPHHSDGNGKLNLLFLGGLSQRKGLADVFEVYEKLDKKKFNLTVIGRKNFKECRALQNNLQKVNYIPSLSNTEVLSLMRTMDIFFFPSHFEGFALVIMEAMSQGLPVITTNVTSGPIVHGKDGWIVKQNDIEGMIALLNYLETNRHTIDECSKNAIETARANTWEKYQKDLCDVLTQ